MSDRSFNVDLPPGYSLRQGSTLDRALLLKFMHNTYLELSPASELSHLAQTVAQYFSRDTPLWWVDYDVQKPQSHVEPIVLPTSRHSTINGRIVACLWLGSAIDQLQGDRHTHVFLLYVAPNHRRKGIGSALMHQAEAWATAQGDCQIGLQVFQSNQPALSLYQQLGYQTQSLWMVKSLK
uniref:GNAT family N-acetyltransferase n=1 Tax=Oscillatoriales cyanobacterium SpSt-402 TaxID=2282168 RepID=A0A832H6C3_9CYAN